MAERFDPSLWATLEQRDDESRKAYAAFLDYVRMGAGRSLRKLHAEYRRRSDVGAASDLPPTGRLRTLQEWSIKYDWQARLEEYLKEREQAEQSEWEDRRRELRFADWALGDDLRQLGARIIEQAPMFDGKKRVIKGRNGQPDTIVETIALRLREAIEALKLASELQRQAAEMPVLQRHEHSGAGGGKIPISFVQIPGDALDVSDDGSDD